MSSFRYIAQAQQFFDANGLPLAAGSLTFYASGTTTPQTTYSDIGLTIPNPNPIALDTSGVPVNDIWCSGIYTVVVKDVLGAVVPNRSRDSVKAGSELPPVLGNNGQFVTTDGVTFLFASIRQVPDATGQAGKVLGNDGTNAGIAWAAVPLSTGGGATFANYVQNNIRELKQAVTAAATTAMDVSAGSVIALAQAVSITAWTIAGLAATGQAQVFTIVRTKDASATARMITWFAGVKWPGGIAPTLTQTTGGVDIFTFITYDGGVTYYGSYVTGMA